MFYREADIKPIEQALEAIIGREPTTEEIKKFYQVKETCGFSERDSVWSILLAFGHYEILYSEIPKRIVIEANKLIADHKLALSNTAEAAERHVRANLVDGVAETVRKAAKEVVDSTNTIIKVDARKRYLIGVSLSFGLATAVIGLLCWASYSVGAKSSGLSIVRNQATVTKFLELNDISKMMACSGAENQKRHDGDVVYCIPFDQKARRAGGWRIN
jgi:hypothetical protein